MSTSPGRDTQGGPPVNPGVRAMRLQMELARLLGVPLAADQSAREEAVVNNTGWLHPGLPHPMEADGATRDGVNLHLRVSVDRLEALVAALREASRGSRG